MRHSFEIVKNNMKESLVPRRVTAISNQKGGVGKTTLTRELGIYLSSKGKRTLVIDLDPQANLTRSLTDIPSTGSGTGGCHEALKGQSYEISEVQPSLSLLAGDIKMAMLEKTLIAEIDAHTRLKELLEHDGNISSFEYNLIDSPPSLGALTVNTLTATEYLIIPMNPSLYSMQGTNDLMQTVAKVRKSLNSELKLLGVIINAYDQIPVITREIRTEIETSFGEKVFSTVLSKSIKIEEAIAARAGVIASSCKSRDEIEHIGEEFIKRLEET